MLLTVSRATGTLQHNFLRGHLYMPQELDGG